MDDMVKSTIEKADMNTVFYWCVDTLRFFAKKWDMTYEEINVWIFCIIEPVVFFLMLAFMVRQSFRIRKLKSLRVF